jgi:hypothetical protein
MLRRAFPGPFWLFVWILMTVTAPVLMLPGFLRAEELLGEALPVLWWSVAAAPVPAAVVAARFTAGTGRRRTVAGFLAAVAVGTAVAGLFLLLSFAVYRWGIPLRRPAGGELFFGLPLAAAGAAIGHRIALRRTGPVQRPASVRAAVAVALLGALLSTTTLQGGAEFSLDLQRFPSPARATAGAPITYPLPAAGRYGVYAEGSSPVDSGCRITGGAGEVPVELVAIRPGTPGFDATAGQRWIADFTVPEPGAYTLTCPESGDGAAYSVGAIPRIDGLAGALIRAAPPLPVIWLLGALPGLLLLGEAVRRRTRHRQQPTESVR